MVWKRAHHLPIQGILLPPDVWDCKHGFPRNPIPFKDGVKSLGNIIPMIGDDYGEGPHPNRTTSIGPMQVEQWLCIEHIKVNQYLCYSHSYSHSHCHSYSLIWALREVHKEYMHHCSQCRHPTLDSVLASTTATPIGVGAHYHGSIMCVHCL